MNWIDKQTRAIFIEFSVFNPNINLVMVSTILIEFLSSGSILTTATFDPLNLFNDINGLLSFKTICEIIFFILIIYYLIIEIKDLIKNGFSEYINNFWTLIEL